MITFQGIFEVSFLDYLKSKLSANIEVLQNTLHGSYSCIYHQNFIDACTTANWSQIIPMSCIYPAAYPLLRLSSSHDSQMKNTVHTIKDLHGYHPQDFEHNVSDSKSYHSPCCLDAGVQSPKEISDLFCKKSSILLYKSQEQVQDRHQAAGTLNCTNGVTGGNKTVCQIQAREPRSFAV